MSLFDTDNLLSVWDNLSSVGIVFNCAEGELETIVECSRPAFCPGGALNKHPCVQKRFERILHFTFYLYIYILHPRVQKRFERILHFTHFTFYPLFVNTHRLTVRVAVHNGVWGIRH